MNLGIHSESTTYTYDGMDRMTAVDSTGVSWDDNGNMLDRGYSGVIGFTRMTR